LNFELKNSLNKSKGSLVYALMVLLKDTVNQKYI